MEERYKSEDQKYKAAFKDKESGRKGLEAKEEINITTPAPPQEMNPKERLENKSDAGKIERSETTDIEKSGESEAGNETKDFNTKSQHPFIPEPPGFENLEEEDENDPNPNSNPNYSYYPNVAYPSGNRSQDEDES